MKVNTGVHTGERAYCCDLLIKYLVKHSLKVHTSVHNVERPYCCDLLLKHLVKHTV